jgi:hypothetical protein
MDNFTFDAPQISLPTSFLSSSSPGPFIHVLRLSISFLSFILMFLYQSDDFLKDWERIVHCFLCCECDGGRWICQISCGQHRVQRRFKEIFQSTNQLRSCEPRWLGLQNRMRTCDREPRSWRKLIIFSKVSAVSVASLLSVRKSPV